MNAGPVWLNVGCGPFSAPKPWINLDCHQSDLIKPDVLVDPDWPLAGFPDDSVDRVYMGHVLEHIPWLEVEQFLGDVYRAVKPGGEICVVGPDAFRVIQRWKDGLDPEGWELVESILEGPWDRDYSTGYALIEQQLPAWKHARHWWNCFEGRVRFALDRWSKFIDVTPVPITPQALKGWPVVAFTQWQCAVTARKVGV